MKSLRFVDSLTALVVPLFIATVAVTAASQSITTYHYDNYRTGWNSHETTLTPINVYNSNIGMTFVDAVDDQVDAQPLYMRGVNITTGSSQGVHNVLYVATEGNTIFAFDAQTGISLVTKNLGPPIPMPLGCNNNGPSVGINSTPVIDPTTNTLYVMVYTQQSGSPQYMLHALDLGSLTDKVPPQLVTASHTLTDGSTFAFNATYQRQRPGLLLANGNIYAGFGSFCDFAGNLSRGWLLGWQANTLAPLAANDLFDFQANSPNSFFLSSIWMSGYAPSTDDSGNILVVTGNSDPSGTTYDGVTNIQESVVKLSPDLSTVLDLFTPSDWSSLDQEDGDFGSGGVMVLPDQPGTLPHLAVAAGKDGNMYFMNENNLGGFSSSTNNVLGTYNIGGCWCGQSYFVDASDSIPRVVSSGGNNVEVWQVLPTPTPSLNMVAQSTTIPGGQNPGFFTTISSNGNSNAIIWALSHPASTSNTGINLYAFNPDSGSTLNPILSIHAGTWPSFTGNSNLVPVVADGRIYVASYRKLFAFGLIRSVTTTMLSSSLNPSNFGQSVTLTAQVTTTGSKTPTGTVTFKNGKTVLGTETLNSSALATLSTSKLPVGSNALTATYNGDSNNSRGQSPVLTQVVNRATLSISLTSLPNPSALGKPVKFTATLSSNASLATSGTVTFSYNGSTLGTGAINSKGVAVFSTSSLPAGSDVVTASYAGNADYSSASAMVTQTVN